MMTFLVFIAGVMCGVMASVLGLLAFALSQATGKFW